VLAAWLIMFKGSLGNLEFTGDYDRNALDKTLPSFCKTKCTSFFFE
jgi:hypothetical protein